MTNINHGIHYDLSIAIYAETVDIFLNISE